MTEEEAKSKWCPMARALFSIQGDRTQGVKFAATNQFQDDSGKDLHSACIASACMMWREDRKMITVPFGEREAIVGGHCGLAGKP